MIGYSKSIRRKLGFFKVYFQVVSYFPDKLNLRKNTSDLVVFRGFIRIVNGALVFKALHS